MGHVDSPLRDLDAIGPLKISEWAADERGIREIRVLLNGEVVARTTPTAEKTDVSAAYPSFRQGH